MNLSEARFKAKLTQWDLRKKTGIHQSKISLIENDYVIPTDVEKNLIAQALEAKVSEIFPESAKQ